MFKFDIGNIVGSTKYPYLIKNKGTIPEGEGSSFACDGRPGYEVFNLKTKASYWTTLDVAHVRYKLVSGSKAGQVLFG